MQISHAAANAEANALAILLDGGYLSLYAGVVPASANAALGSQTLLATLRFGAPAFGNAVNGVLTANAISSDTAVATGTATFYRSYEVDGVTVISQGTIGVSGSGADFEMNSVNIQINAIVQISNFRHQVTE